MWNHLWLGNSTRFSRREVEFTGAFVSNDARYNFQNAKKLILVSLIEIALRGGCGLECGLHRRLSTLRWRRFCVRM